MIQIALSQLRVMPPTGSPVVHPDGRVGVLVPTEQGLCVRARYTECDPGGLVLYLSDELSDWSLDLSEPSTARIDGATVAATMLAEAVDLDVSRGVVWWTSKDGSHLPRLCLDTRRGTAFFDASPVPGPPYVHVPALASLVGPEPIAILATVVRSVLGVIS